MIRVPVVLEAEYRGQQPAGTFTDRDTGQVVDYAPKLKFEYEDGEDVVLLPVGAKQLDNCEPAVDYKTFKRGDRFRLEGMAVLQDRGSDKDSFLTIRSCVPVKAAALSRVGG